MIGKLKNHLFRIIYHLLRFQNYIPVVSNVSIHPNAKVFGCRLDGNIVIGEGSKISRTEIYGYVEIGRYTSVNGPNVDLYASKGKITIGNFCSIARNVTMQLTNHNFSHLTTYPIFKNFFNEYQDFEEVSKGDIIIGHDVWIGTHVVVLPGVKINHGAVVAANSVVTCEVPPYAIIGGSPAKVLKYRFDEKKIESLLKLNWWDWDRQKLLESKSLFLTDLNDTDFNLLNE